jgi:hypothetical protein
MRPNEDNTGSSPDIAVRTKKTNDRAIGVNISLPQSLFNKIDEKRGNTSRSVFVREAILKYLETI